jgi:hypothetical protein
MDWTQAERQLIQELREEAEGRGLEEEIWPSIGFWSCAE